MSSSFASHDHLILLPQHFDLSILRSNTLIFWSFVVVLWSSLSFAVALRSFRFFAAALQSSWSLIAALQSFCSSTSILSILCSNTSIISILSSSTSILSILYINTLIFLILCNHTLIYLILFLHATCSTHDHFAGWSIPITLGHNSKYDAILHKPSPWSWLAKSSTTKCRSHPHPVHALLSMRTHCRPSIPLRLGTLPSEYYTMVSTLTCR